MKNKLQDYFDKTSEYLHFFVKNKELVFIPYFIWVTIQIIILLSILGFSGLSYLSITFSLIIFIIVSFLFILSIPTFILFILFIFILSFVDLWNSWIIWKIFVILYILLLLVSPFIASKIKFIKTIKDKYKDKVERFYIKSWIIFFVFLFFALIFMVFSFKVATINYWNNQKVYWKYLFYNQDYYFLDICWKKLIIPSNKVESIEIKTESYKFSSMKLEEINKLNQEYDNYCEDYLHNNIENKKLKLWD